MRPLSYLGTTSAWALTQSDAQCAKSCDCSSPSKVSRKLHTSLSDCGSRSFHAAARASIACAGGQSRKPLGALEKETRRSEEHTSELQSLMRNSYAVFCLKKKTTI